MENKERITLSELHLRLSKSWDKVNDEEGVERERKKLGVFWKMYNPRKEEEEFDRLQYIVFSIDTDLEPRPLFAVLKYQDGTIDYNKCDKEFMDRFCLGIYHADKFNANWVVEPFPEIERLLLRGVE